MHNFTPWASLIGGLMIGGAAALLLLVAGRIAGISGMLEALLRPRGANFTMALAFLVGLPLGAGLVALLAPGAVPAGGIAGGWGVLIAAGFAVGLGARLAGGCTSGHGVCGLPRLSVRSMVATLTFMATAALTVALYRHAI